MLQRTSNDFYSSDFLSALFNNLSDAVYLLDPISSNVLWVNKVGYKVLNMDISEVLDHSVLSLQKNVVGDTQWQSIAEVIRTNRNFTFIGSHMRKDGTEFPVEVNTSVFSYDNHEYFLSIARDISQRRANEAINSSSEKQLIAAINASSDGLWDWHMETNNVFMSDSWKRMLGFGTEELENTLSTWKDNVHPDDLAQVMQALSEHLSGTRDRYQAEYRLKNRNGHYIWVKDTGCISAYDAEGNATRVTGLVTDITDYKQLEQRLLALASYDELTGLRNRRECARMFSEQLDFSKRNNTPLAVALFDLDYFKAINDKYGHLAGDTVLTDLAKHLLETIRTSDYLFRWGGEEFFLLCPQTTIEEMEIIANKIRTTLSSYEIAYEGHVIQTTASFGIAAYPKHGDSQKSLMLAADSALYRAKSEGRNCICTVS